MENPISITSLNDFIFCPASIYFHSIDYDTETLMYKNDSQLNGSAAHKSIDNVEYSSKKSILQAIPVYCEKYNLEGKIDTFDIEKGILTERKKKLKNIYDGYVFQVYSQYFSLIEMGYKVNQIRIYSMDDNKIYNIEKPENNKDMLLKFEKVINDINNFNLETFHQSSKEKCEKCIYETMCSYSNIGD